MTKQHDLESIVHDWLHHTLDAVPDPTHRYGLVASEVNQTPQQRAWVPLPPMGQHTLWSTGKYIVAISIVALFGGILLTAALTTPQVDRDLAAMVSEQPAFPTGTFEAEEDGLTLEFHADGTCVRAGVPCRYGVSGNRFSEMTFEEPAGAQVPATYYWDFDGESLTFEPWGTDERPTRGSTYADHVYHPVGETLPLIVTETGFPIGEFVATGDSSTSLSFHENGRWRAGSPTGGAAGAYTVSEDLYTEMTHNHTTSAQVPATYRWHWDGERLSFVMWGEDADAWRKSFYLGHVYVMAEKPTGPLRTLILSDPRLDVWVTVEISELENGRYEAIATIDGEPFGEGVGDTQQEAVRAALAGLGEPYASDMARSFGG